jgi:NAD+ synthase
VDRHHEPVFSVPFDKLDLCSTRATRGSPRRRRRRPGSTKVVERVYEDIERKRRGAEYLHAPPLLVADLDRPS